MSYLDRTDLAHVQPSGTHFDDLGRGEEEGIRNFDPVPDSRGASPIDVLRQVASAGFTRKRVPHELIVLNGGASGAIALNGAGDPVAALEALMPEIATGGVATALRSGTATQIDPRAKAKMQGYEGDPCGDCGNYTLVRNGTCMKCNTCGGTSGCS